MNTQQQGRGKSNLRWYSIFFAGVVLSCAVPLLAQTTTCGTRDNNSNPNRGKGDDIKCRIETILDKSDQLIGAMDTRLNSCTGPRCKVLKDRFQKAKSAQDRGKISNGRAKKEDYEDLNTHRKVKCKGNCNSDNPNVEGGESDPNIGLEIADQLDEVTEGLNQANELLAEEPPAAASILASTNSVVASGGDPLYDYTLDPNFPLILGGGVNPKLSFWSKYGLSLLTEVLDQTKDITEKVCDQTVVAAGFGGNSSAFCIGLVVAYHISNWLLEYVKLIDGEIQSWETHGAYARAGNLYNNMATLQTSVGDTGTALDGLQTQVNALKSQVTELQSATTALRRQLVANKAVQEQIIQLLLVPDGKKVVNPEVLTCTGNNDCPKVLDCPGSHCSFQSR